MPVPLKDLVRLHDAARTCHRERTFDTEQVRWHGASGPRGGWVIMHPEPEDGATERSHYVFWVWPVILIEGSIDHLRLLIDDGKDLPGNWQAVVNDVHLAYGNQAPDLVEQLMDAIYPLPKGGVLDGFDPVHHLRSVANEMGKAAPWSRLGMSLRFREESDLFELYAFEIHGEILDCNRYDPHHLCIDPFLSDLLRTNGPEWISC